MDVYCCDGGGVGREGGKGGTVSVWEVFGRIKGVAMIMDHDVLQ